MSVAVLARTLLLPAAIAVLLYLLGIYVLRPAYESWRERSTYSLLPASSTFFGSSLDLAGAGPLTRAVVQSQRLITDNVLARRCSAALGSTLHIIDLAATQTLRDAGARSARWFRRDSSAIEERFGLGDEELAEADRQLVSQRGDAQIRRLSRDLEAGFLDDSE